MASELENKIIQQIEYYFGDLNLPRDKFMQEKIKEDNGWICMNVMMNFKRLSKLSRDPKVVVDALKKSNGNLIELSEDGKKIRRNPELPCPELTDSYKKDLVERTAYVVGFSIKEPMDNIFRFIGKFGEVQSFTRRRHRRDRRFKGACFITFNNRDTCRKFIEIDDLRYKDAVLIRMWQTEYFDERRKEYEERVKAREAKKQEQLDEVAKQFSNYPRCASIHFTGIPEGRLLTREEIKHRVVQVCDNLTLSFIQFNRGDVEGYLRFATENAAVEFVNKNPEGQLEVDGVKLKLNVLEGADEQQYLMSAAEAVIRKKERIEARRYRKEEDSNEGEPQTAE